MLAGLPVEEMEMEEGCGGGVPKLVGELIKLAAMLKELETQSHLIHVNAEGPTFLEVHAFLKERYEEHLEQFDVVSELVRTLDHFMPMCACGLKDALPLFKNVETYETRSMLLTYYVNVESFGYLAKSIERLAAEVEAPDVQNRMADLVGSAFKVSWKLKALLRHS